MLLTLDHFPLLLNCFFLTLLEACSSRSTPKPRPPAPTPRPNVTFPTFECPPAYAKWYCLNGATCFTVQIGESILYNCECADGFMGQRCEFKDVEGSYLPSRQRVMLEKASIAGGATFAVFLVVILSIVLYINWQRRLKESRTHSPTTVVDGGEIRVRVAELESQPQQQRRRPFASRGSASLHTLTLAEIHRQQMQQLQQQQQPPRSTELTTHLSSGFSSAHHLHHPPPLTTSSSPSPPLLPPIGKKPLSATTLPTDASYDVVDSGTGGAGETGADIGPPTSATVQEHLPEPRPLSRYTPS